MGYEIADICSKPYNSSIYSVKCLTSISVKFKICKLRSNNKGNIELETHLSKRDICKEIWSSLTFVDKGI